MRTLIIYYILSLKSPFFLYERQQFWVDSFAAHLHSRRIFLLKFQQENATAIRVYCK